MPLLAEISGVKDGRVITKDAAGDRVEVKKDKVGWDITAYVDGKAVKTAYGIDKTTALQKARDIADYYRDDNGQSLAIKTLDSDDQDRLKVLRNNLEAAKKTDPQEAREFQEEIDKLEAEMAGTKDGHPFSIKVDGERYYKMGERWYGVDEAIPVSDKILIQKLEKEYKDKRTKDGGPGSGIKGHRTAKVGQEMSFESKNYPGVKMKGVVKFVGKSGVIVKTSQGKQHFIRFNSTDSLSFSPDEAKSIGEKAGADFAKINLEQFRMGLEVELEHQDITNGDPEKTAKIVLAHLQELPDYYTRLKKMESGVGTKDGGPGSGVKGHMTVHGRPGTMHYKSNLRHQHAKLEKQLGKLYEQGKKGSSLYKRILQKMERLESTTGF